MVNPQLIKPAHWVSSMSKTLAQKLRQKTRHFLYRKKSLLPRLAEKKKGMREGVYLGRARLKLCAITLSDIAQSFVCVNLVFPQARAAYARCLLAPFTLGLRRPTILRAPPKRGPASRRRKPQPPQWQAPPPAWICQALSVDGSAGRSSRDSEEWRWCSARRATAPRRGR